MIIHQNFVVLYLRLHKRLISSMRVVIKDNLPAKAYKPEIVEKRKYEEWEKNKLFQAENPSEKPTFSMILPPPNVTGKLHLGHALACTIQDVIVRRKRAMGYNVLWLPGIDHAGIATQGIVEKYLKSTHNINRQDIGREKFNKEVWKWKEKHGNTICQQLRTLGCSLDWSREIFTMDAKRTHAVNTAFLRLFKKGLIYRKKALVNWCNKLKSTVSDIEVDNLILNSPKDIMLPGYETPVRFGLLYNFAYKIYDSDDEVIVSTTMPETMLGDTAIAVHPNDSRYQHLIGQRAVHPFLEKTIPIIYDEFVDLRFGTGAVKITPAHSKVDYEVAKRHQLPLIEVVDEEGLMKNAEQFNRLKRYDCRQKLVIKLEELGLLKSVVPHQMSLPVCSRTGDIIEHLPKEQWFLSCSDLNKKAAELVTSGQLKIEPDKFVKNWLNWTNDDRDWCISRQLWWGHQIPAYKCSVDKEIIWIAAMNESSAKEQASKYLRTLPDMIRAERDTDVLDTWFSSGLYPLASLGWPQQHEEKDFKMFYPLSLLATGHDILGLWVHRMVILGLELTGTLSFNNILLHGVICDSKGAKMSKSKGNIIDPIDVINGITMNELEGKTQDMHKKGVLSKEELQKALAYHQKNYSHTNGIPECGVDALRFTLLTQDVKSHYVNFDVDLCYANKLFCNKIWQSIKYTQIAFNKLKVINEEVTQKDLTCFDKWILSKLGNMVEKVNNSMDKYEFHLATKALRTLIYNEFCDIYLEATKPGFENSNMKMWYAHAHTLSTVLNTSLRCLAPFMIYVTDELIPKIPAFEKNIIYNFNDTKKKYLDFPQYKDFKVWKNEELEKKVDRVLNTIYLVRQLKGFYNITNKKPCIYVKSVDDSLKSDLKENTNVLLYLTKSRKLKFEECSEKCISGLLDKDTKVAVELVGDDTDSMILAARHKLENRIRKVEESLTKLEAKFSSEHYLATVPEWAQMQDREKLLTKKEELKQLQRLIIT